MDFQKIIIGLLFITLLGGLYLIYKISFSKNNSDLPKITLEIKSQKFEVEVARTLSQRSLGLGNRTDLCQNCGMIFVFSSESILPFWMKDTLIPLDMIWLDKNGKVVDIQTAVPEPGVNDFALKIYKNSIPAQYVLELNAGSAAALSLSINDSLDLTPLHHDSN